MYHYAAVLVDLEQEQEVDEYVSLVFDVCHWQMYETKC